MRPPHHSTLYHGCHACGACCDSAPELTVRELFELQDVFIGCLAIERSREVNDKGGEVGRLYQRSVFDPGHVYRIFPRAFSFDSTLSCGALNSDGRCSLHSRGKPGVCDLAPFDAKLPNDAQARLLQERRQDTERWGAHCISYEPTAELRPVVRLRTVNPEIAFKLSSRRNELEDDQTLVFDAVFAELEPWLLGPSAPLTRLPPHSQVTLSLVPLLLALARKRVEPALLLGYVDSQNQLLEQTIEAGFQRANPADQPQLGELGSWHKKNQAFRQSILRGRAQGAAGSN